MPKLYILLLSLSCFQFAKAQTTLTIVADKDNTMYSAYPGNSNGAGEFLFVGKNSPNNNGSVQRALLHFDLTAIPAGAVITSATLTIYVNRSAPTATGIELHKMTADWGEGTSDAAGKEASGVAATTNDATWSQRMFPSTAWGTPGGDFSATVSASVSTIAAGITASTATPLSGPDLTSDVQGWVANPSTNLGWGLVSNNEAAEASVKRIISRNSATTAQRPSLSITYSTSLPVTLKDFSAALRGQNVVLQWSTTTELDNDYFDIQHSATGKDFTSIGRVKGSGASTTARSYSFTHENVAVGKHFYRLVQNDKNGNKEYSSVISLSSADVSKLQVYPNPASSFISIAASSLLQGKPYTVNSPSGQIALKGTLTGQQIDVQKLASGQYWLIIKTDAGEWLSAQFLKK